MNTGHCIKVCNRLLRGERSAADTYEQAIKKIQDDSAAAVLRRLRDEHLESVRALERNVISMGGAPDQTSGAWGVFARTIQGAANLLGLESALQALETGEERGEDDYRRALNDEDVMLECKDLIRLTLLPRIDAHLDELDRLQMVTT